MTIEGMLPDDAAFAALSDQLIADARAMLPEKGDAVAQFVTTLSAWLIQLNHRAGRQSVSLVKAAAADAAKQAAAPLETRLDHALTMLARMEAREQEIHARTADMLTGLHTRLSALEAGGDHAG
jgi:hypothetical protein